MGSARLLRNVTFSILGVVLLVLGYLMFSTYSLHHTSPYLDHTAIMAGMIVVAVAFGFAAAQFMYAEVLKTRKQSKSILDVVLMFLSGDEKKILNYLVEHNGETKQAEIAKLPNMSRVKAHRLLQKMQEKEIVEIIPHGKVRRVVVKEHILRVLAEKE